MVYDAIPDTARREGIVPRTCAAVYDGNGNRVSETVGGTTMKYLVDTLNPTGYPQVLDELVSGGGHPDLRVRPAAHQREPEERHNPDGQLLDTSVGWDSRELF